MNHEQYKQQRLGKRVDFDNSFGFQCVDLARHYMREVHKYNSGTFSWSAINWYNTGSPFDNSREKKVWFVWVKQGDIVFQNPNKQNPYWHVAICDSINRNTIIVLEQNWETWRWLWLWADAIRLKSYPLSTIVWYYTRENKENPERTKAIQECMKANSEAWNKANVCKDYVTERTIASLNELQVQLEKVNKIFRDAWFDIEKK